MSDFFETVGSNLKASFEVVGDVVDQAVKNVSTSVKKAVDVAALNTKIRRLTVEISTEFMKIGELVYETHKDPDTLADNLNEMIERIDGLYAELDEVKEERDRRSKEE